MTNKQFLLVVCGIYVAGCVLGLVVLKSPDYTAAYMAKHGHEHERYLEVIENPAFHLHEERPALNPLPEALVEDAHFVEEYRANPEFQAEKRRMFYYNWYFRFLNAVIFVALLVRFTKAPLLGFLDSRISDLRTNIESADREARDAAAVEGAARAKVEQWQATAADIRKETETRVGQSLAQIGEEFAQARAQLEKETADRKQAELYRASRAVRQQIVDALIEQLEQRHKDDATLERLGDNVDQFARLMDRLS